MTKRPPKHPDELLDDDDRALWRAVTKDIIPIHKPTPIKTETKLKPAPQHPLKPIAARAAVTAAPKLVPAPSSHKSSFQTDKRTHQKFKDGQMDFDGSIDLHGMTLAEAHQAFSKFIRAHIKQHSRMLLVITGKGKGGEGIIRTSLPSWIDEADIDHSVLKFASASAKHGGSGAFYILLRRAR